MLGLASINVQRITSKIFLYKAEVSHNNSIKVAKKNIGQDSLMKFITFTYTFNNSAVRSTHCKEINHKPWLSKSLVQFCGKFFKKFHETGGRGHFLRKRRHEKCEWVFEIESSSSSRPVVFISSWVGLSGGKFKLTNQLQYWAESKENTPTPTVTPQWLRSSCRWSEAIDRGRILKEIDIDDDINIFANWGRKMAR